MRIWASDGDQTPPGHEDLARGSGIAAMDMGCEDRGSWEKNYF